MSEPRLIEETRVRPCDISLGKRLRPVTEAGLAALIVSIKSEGGIRNPVHLRRIKGRKGRPAQLRLIAGAFRVEAAARLETDVPAMIWHCTDDQAAMMEIDDQIAGQGLMPLDLALFLAERKAVYERLFPESKRGGARGNQYTGGRQSEIISFCQNTASQLGLSVRSLEQYVRIGETLKPNEIKDLRATKKPVGVVELLALAKINDPNRRAAVCSKLGCGEARSVSAALDLVKGISTPIQTPAERHLIALLDTWSRAPLAAKRAFLQEKGNELAELMAQTERTAA